jgi:hypothetical protein
VSRLAALLATLCAALLLAGPAQARSVPRGWLGVQADGPLTERGNPFGSEWSLMAASGVESVRAAFDWRAAQPTADGPIDFGPTDAMVLSAARAGLPVLPVVQWTPAWAAAHRGDGAGSPPRADSDYIRFLVALVRRYGPRGSLWAQHRDVPRRPIRAWQVWNEPNFRFYWSRQPFARRYVKLLRASRRALRRADRGSRTILAGLANESWVALRAIYRAGGRGTFDAVAVHPYTKRPRDVLRLVERSRRVTREFHDGRRPIWVTELSWPASKGKATDAPRFVTDERGQASRLSVALTLLARNRRRLRIGRVVWYTWLSREPSPFLFDWSGLRRLHGDRVANAGSLAAFRRVAHRLERRARR